MLDDIINKKEKVKINLLKGQAEKSIYLGEFKENVLAAIEKVEIERNIVHEEIKEAMRDKRATLIKIRRDIPFNAIKPYIDEAEKIGLRYTLVDDISFKGDIGLVVVSGEALENEDKNVVVESATKIYTDAGLSEGYLYAEGKKISPKHYKEIKTKLPERLERFEEMNIFDRFFGKIDPINTFEKKGR